MGLQYNHRNPDAQAHPYCASDVACSDQVNRTIWITGSRVPLGQDSSGFPGYTIINGKVKQGHVCVLTTGDAVFVQPGEEAEKVAEQLSEAA